MNARESLIEAQLKKESEENDKSKKELNVKLCQKQNEILKLQTDFQKMKLRNEEEKKKEENNNKKV